MATVQSAYDKFRGAHRFTSLERPGILTLEAMWEYHTEEVTLASAKMLVHHLNILGQQRWELVTVLEKPDEPERSGGFPRTRYTIVLKRPKN